MGYTSKAVSAHLRSTLHQYLRGDNRQAVIGINYGDIVKHAITCATLGIPENSVLVLLGQFRTAGTGLLAYYPENGTFGIQAASANSTDRLECIPVPLLNHELWLRQSVGTDTWDLYVFGYIVEGTVEG